MQNLEIQTTERSRLPDVDFDNLGFGGNFADHMFSMVYEDGRWTDHKIVPYGPIPIAPEQGLCTTVSPLLKASRLSTAPTVSFEYSDLI